MDFSIILNDRKVGLKFAEFPGEAHDALLAALRRATDELLSKIIEGEPELTGELKSETTSKVYDDGSKMAGRVFVAFDSAQKTAKGSLGGGKVAALEYGAHGAALVRAHEASLGHIYGRMVEPMSVLVSAYTRQVNIQERAFLRGPLEEMAPDILDQLKGALASSIAEEPA